MIDLATFYLILGVILRIAIPIAITLFIGWFLNRLDDRWQAEARKIHQTLKLGTQPELVVQPCWEFQNCSAAKRENCPIYGKEGIVCWEFFSTNGTLRSQCQICTFRLSVPSVESSLT